MNITRNITAVLLLAALGTTATAYANVGKTREQVKAELAEAIRTGDIIVGETGLRRNEIDPRAYPARPAVAGKTRDEVKAELADAIRSGDIVVGETGLKLNQINPRGYPAGIAVAGKTREQVKAELAEAIRTGDVVVGETSMTLKEMFPQRYAGLHASVESDASNMAQYAIRGVAATVAR